MSLIEKIVFFLPLFLSIPGAIASTLDIAQTITRYIRKLKRKPKAK